MTIPKELRKVQPDGLIAFDENEQKKVTRTIEKYGVTLSAESSPIELTLLIEEHPRTEFEPASVHVCFTHTPCGRHYPPSHRSLAAAIADIFNTRLKTKYQPDQTFWYEYTPSDYRSDPAAGLIGAKFIEIGPQWTQPEPLRKNLLSNVVSVFVGKPQRTLVDPLLTVSMVFEKQQFQQVPPLIHFSQDGNLEPSASLAKADNVTSDKVTFISAFLQARNALVDKGIPGMTETWVDEKYREQMSQIDDALRKEIISRQDDPPTVPRSIELWRATMTLQRFRFYYSTLGTCVPNFYSGFPWPSSKGDVVKRIDQCFQITHERVVKITARLPSDQEAWINEVRDRERGFERLGDVHAKFIFFALHSMNIDLTGKKLPTDPYELISRLDAIAAKQILAAYPNLTEEERKKLKLPNGDGTKIAR